MYFFALHFFLLPISPSISPPSTNPDRPFVLQTRFPPPKAQSKTLTPINHFQNSLSLLIFSISIALLPIPSHKTLAFAAPIATEATSKSKSRKSSASVLREHEFSSYTKRLLVPVEVLLERIEDVKAGRGVISGVRAALKGVKKKREEVQGEVLEKLNLELRELRREKAELVKRAGEVLESAVSAKRVKDRILKAEEAGNEEAKGELERLDGEIEEADREYSGLWEKVGEIEDKILRKETLVYSVAIRELGFIERESKLLVDRFGAQLRRGSIE